MEFLRRLYQQLRLIWTGMSVPARIGLGAFAGVALLLLIGVGFWAAQVDYRVLYSNLSAEDAAASVEVLKEKGIDYRLEAGGSTIKVPAEKAADARLALAEKGLPIKAGPDLSLFDQAQFGWTPDQFDINKMRALQGELARTIQRIDPVQNARVHIVLPRDTLFVGRDRKPATASVHLTLKPGSALNQAQARTIQKLVANGVEGLEPDKVMVADERGHDLSQPMAADPLASSTQMEFTKSVERDLENKAMDMLAQHFGPGKAIVRITAKTDFTRKKETKKTLSKDKVLRIEKIASSKSTSASGPRGVTGAVPNTRVATAGLATPGQVPVSSQSEEGESSFDPLNESQEIIEYGVGEIKRLTISAAVDLSSEQVGEAGKKWSEAKARKIIEQAVGFDTKRGDTMEIVDAPAWIPPKEPEDKDLAKKWIELAIRVALGLAGVLVLVLLAWAILRRARPVPPPPLPPPGEAEILRRRERLSTLAERYPDLFARLLASWLEEAAAAQKKQPKPT